MPGLLVQIDQSVAGVDLASLASGAAGQYAGLGQLITQWQGGAPGDFGAALGGLASLRAPDVAIGGSLGSVFSGLLPSLQGDLGGLVANLEGDVAALPGRVRDELVAAIAPLLERIETLHGLLESDWSCGLFAEFSPPAEAGAGAGGGAGGGGGGAAGGGAAATSSQGTLSATQVSAAQARIDTLPADLSVPSLLRWVHQRVGTFRPGYFTLRSLPILDDIRDPLDTLIRWDDATAVAVQAELQQTIATLAALIRTATTARLAAALPAPSVAALPTAALGAAAEPWIAALEALATAVQAGDTANLAARLTSAQAARAALLAQNAAIATAGEARVALRNGLTTLPGTLDAGICRTLVLLQPRASFADLTAGIGPLQIPPLPADPFAPLTDLIGQLRDLITGLLDALDISAVNEPVTAALDSANDAVEAVEQGLAQLTAQASAALGEARGAIQSLDLDGLREQAEQALEAVLGELLATVTDALSTASAALGEALAAAGSEMDAIDPETLTEPIREALDALGNLTGQAPVQQLMTVIEQLEQLAQTIARLSFEPVADEVIAAIGELNELIRSIDISSLPDPGPALIGEAISILPQSLVPITDPLIVDLDTQIEASPIELLERVKALPDQVRERLLAFSPRAVLQPVLAEPYRKAVGELENFSPQQWLAAADQPLADLRARLRQQLDVAALLADAARAHAAVLAELDRFRPATLLAPLGAALDQALTALDDALPLGELADGLTAVLDRVRGFTRTLDSALDVADHLVQKLDALGDAGAGFDTWIDGILAKVPETATGALATALADLRAAARDVRPAQLTLDWAAARAPLATALAQAGATARLTRLTLARGRILSGLGALPPAAAASRDAIAAWLAEPQTRAAGDGLTALATLDRALADADAALQTQFSQLAERFPHADGPLAPLVPADPATVRVWVREAIVRQFGMPVVSFLDGLKLVAGLLGAAASALRELVGALDDKLDEVLAAPQALADLLGNVDAVKERLAGLNPATYSQEVDAVYTALLDEFRALDPRALGAALESARDRVLGQISLDGILPAALRGQLDALHRELVTKIGALDPDALLLTPLDEAYRETIEPLVAALDVSATIQIIIDWLRGLPEDLRAQIGRVDVAYGQLLASAPSGGGSAGASVSVGVST